MALSSTSTDSSRTSVEESSSTTGITLDGVSKHFGTTAALNQVSVVVEPGEFFSLLGPSGCGKTTLLRIVAGFENPDSGRVLFGDRDMTKVPPQSRPTAMVFQNYALFPNMTVGENVAYGLRVRKVPTKERTRRVLSALAGVGLDELIDRPIAALSGGQQQRVALARAVAVEPRVLLFDEPLSNLDLALRERTRTEIRRLQKSLGITSLYVTHDQLEAMALSDRIAVMRDGVFVEVGTPERLFESPETAFVASFLGGSNIIRDRTLVEALIDDDSIPEVGKVLAVRPQHLEITGAADDRDRGSRLAVDSSQYLGSIRELVLTNADGVTLRLHQDPTAPVFDVVKLRATNWSWVSDEGQ